MASAAPQPLRPCLELFKDGPQLRSLLRFLREEAAPRLCPDAPLRLNVPNKRAGQAKQLLQTAATIVEAVPGAQVCLHYSLKYQPGGSAAFRSFCGEADRIPGCSVLLVSGTGARRGLDSCSCLEELAREGAAVAALPPLGVAFSPFEEPGPERAKLLRKLRTGLVSQVWLQLGSDLTALRAGLEFLTLHKAMGLHGSVFLPTQAMLNKQRARPWAGVCLSDEYLGSIRAAEAVTRRMLTMFAEFGVTPLIESPVEDVASAAAVAALLRSAQQGLPAPAAAAARAPPAAQGDTVTVTGELGAGSAQRRWGRGMWKPKASGSGEITTAAAAEVPASAPAACISLCSDESGGEESSGGEPWLTEASSAPAAPTAPAAAAPLPGVGAAAGQGAALVWFRQDLRTHDNAALVEACKRHTVMVPIFVWAPAEDGDHCPGAAAQIWLREALRSLASTLERLGSPLVLRRSRSYSDALLEVAREVDASAVYYSKRYESLCQQADRRTTDRLRASGLDVHGLPGYLLYEPTAVNVGRGYTTGHWGTLMPFYKACQATGRPRRPLAAPEMLRPAAKPASSLSLEALGLDSGVAPGGEDWGAAIRAAWPHVSEQAALQIMRDYIGRGDGLRVYEQQRSRADLENNPNSKLSAYLRWGQLSPNDLFWAVQDAGLPREQTKTFGRRLFWRDLAYFQMHHFPDMARKGIRAHYDTARWRDPRDGLLRRWRRGETGYPLVDASMRELRATGWVQQNVRMVAASFLTEFLNISWVEGAKWYEDQLVDADIAINSMMWQNAGRSGTDQWNFLISPVSAKTQDPSGAYVRKWLPELAQLPTKFIHTPWEASAEVLARARVTLGSSYPDRCIWDLSAAREESKQATLAMRRSIAGSWMNNSEGYDVVALPGGATTKLFTKQEYRLAKDGRQLRPSAGPSRPNKGGGKGGPGSSEKGKGGGANKGKGKRQQPSGSRRASPASRGQLTIERFVAPDAKKVRWARLREQAPGQEPIDVDGRCCGG